MKWQQFENSNQIEKFIRAFHQLHEPILRQIKSEKAWFDHYWLQQLNLSDCFLLEGTDGPNAVVTYPKVPDVHYLRWQNPTLAARPGFEIPHLPRAIEKKSSHFYTPLYGGSGCGIKIATMKVNPVQYCTAANVFEGSLELQLPDGIEHKLVQTVSDAHMAIRVFQSRISEFGSEDFFGSYYLPLLCKEIEKIPTGGGAWCTFSLDTSTGLPIAAALYSGWELPLGGPRTGLVDDIVVLPAYRRRNIATSLQTFAYFELKNQGVKWICGNIEKENLASLRQSEKLGRKPWCATILVKENS